MPPRGKNKGKEKIGLGRSLTKSKTRGIKTEEEFRNRHVVDHGETGLKSVLEETDVEMLMSRIAVGEKKFVGEKSAPVIIPKKRTLAQHKKKYEEDEEIQKRLWEVTVPIPRRPPWTRDIGKEVLEARELESFLQWRNELSVLQEENSFLLTPFEKNLEVWRQLWRVLERSDVVCQIVDARNPLLFWCRDLASVVKEIDSRKEVVFVLNKSDLLSEQQRRAWDEYLENVEKMEHFSFSCIENIDDSSVDEFVRRLSSVLEKKGTDLSDKKTVVVGLVGYPNVGKSSLINVLCSAKKVGVDPTPGKTKHFQTIVLPSMFQFCGEEREIVLCDCPGLVFPNVFASKEDMICSGIISIDTLRNHISPVTLVFHRIPSCVLESRYGLPAEIVEDTDTVELLELHGRLRGKVDVTRTARTILRDFVQGRVIYSHPPPTLSRKEVNEWWTRDLIQMNNVTSTK